MPKTTTIPKGYVKEDDLVIIPRKEYEELLALKKIKEFKPTAAQRGALARAMDNFKEGKTLSDDEFARLLVS